MDESTKNKNRVQMWENHFAKQKKHYARQRQLEKRVAMYRKNRAFF
jgi:hypothetical protein